MLTPKLPPPEGAAEPGACAPLGDQGSASSPDGAGTRPVFLGPSARHAAGQESTPVHAPFRARSRAPLSSLTRSDDASQRAHLPVSTLRGAPSGVNGNLSEPLTPFEESHRAELRLMGSYLSRPCPGPPSHTLSGADSWERLDRLGFAFPARRNHWGAPTLDLTSPPCLGDHRGYVVVHGRPYPTQQAQWLFLGVFSSAPRNGPQKPAPSACSFKMFCTSVIAKMASAKGKMTLPLALMQTVFCRGSQLLHHLPNAGGKQALEQSYQLRAKEEKDPAAPVGSGTGLAPQEEAHPAPERQDHPRRGRDGGAGAQSAFTPLMVNGVLSSFVPRPGPLRRDLCSKGLDDDLKKTSQTYLLSSRSKGNANTSSYRSTGELPPLQGSHQGAAGAPGSASSHRQVPAKKAREESRRARSSASAEPQRKTMQEKVAGVSSGEKQNLKRLSTPSSNSRPQKRRIPLLLPCRRSDPLDLPPSLELAYGITAEDLDLENSASLQWINKVLEG